MREVVISVKTLARSLPIQIDSGMVQSWTVGLGGCEKILVSGGGLVVIEREDADDLWFHGPLWGLAAKGSLQETKPETTVNDIEKALVDSNESMRRSAIAHKSTASRIVSR